DTALRSAAVSRSAEGGGGRDGLPDRAGGCMACEYSASRGDRAAEFDGARRDVRVHCVSSDAVHGSRVFDSGKERLRGALSFAASVLDGSTGEQSSATVWAGERGLGSGDFFGANGREPRAGAARYGRRTRA